MLRKVSVRPSPVPVSKYTKNPFFFKTGLIIGLDPLVQGVRVCVIIKSTISDCIITTLLSFTERATLHSEGSCNMHIGSLRWLRSISCVTCTS